MTRRVEKLDRAPPADDQPDSTIEFATDSDGTGNEACVGLPNFRDLDTSLLAPTTVDDPAGDAQVLMLSWGSLSDDLGDLFARYDKVVILEMDLGHIAALVGPGTS